ncbi:hypothetical protein FDP08_16815 [Marinobacter panjinensis]|uniref:Carboxypeptidase regulatory-like domain-containing protein n=1 Tax=Marinobacter panjinensis TaxID=2576384 RepID=A0A4U6QVQ8_9GAMM|nr:hypothetical protein [Marinobacter panjinensis]MCR8914837.1 hypothetical protein [Marinobacter panjinensis]TKV64086.1 hypothetical protein FDP08_16815 [Marinobacter panjinensis]
MKRLLPISVALFTLALAGCGEESDESPVDGRDFDAQDYSEPRPYTGRVIDGYLRHARVWLDMDGDSQYTPGPMTIKNSAGTEITLPNGEPTAMTGEDGKFTLDTTGLVQDPSVSPDIDPRDFPLFAVILPGQTLEQTRMGDVVLEDAYMLSAPPGVRDVTPLSTLVRQRRVIGVQDLTATTNDLADALGNVNLLSDYVKSGDHRAHAYARAFARFMASQFPDDYASLLRGGDGRERFLSKDAAFLLGVSFVRNALDVVKVVDEAASQGNYENVDVDGLALPEVPIELEDPVILERQTVLARGEGSELPASMSNLGVSAELVFDYSEDGRVTSITAHGCMMPSLREMARLINAGGKIANTGTQWMPGISLSQESAGFYEDEGPDERLVFDWENRRATFETTTGCHPGLASSSALGGVAAISYEWTMANTQVQELIATSGDKTEVLEPDYQFGTDAFFGFTRTVDETEEEIMTLSGDVESCDAAIDPDDADAALLVSAQQPYTVSGSIPQPDGFSPLALEFDNRNDRLRPLRFGFLDPAMASTTGVNNIEGFDWAFYYPFETSNEFVEEQPNLIGTAYLNRRGGSRVCGREFERMPSAAYARVNYTYQRLSEYLSGLVE